MKSLKTTAFALCLVLSACGGDKKENNENGVDYSQQGEVTQGDMIVSAAIGGATNLVPWLAGESAASDIAGHIYNQLLKYDKNLNIEGDLAEKWLVEDEGKKITFTLKQGITWEDGKPFTAHDVMATFEALIDPNTRTPYAGDFQIVSEAKVLDDYTFQVTYPAPFAPALASWVGLAILPKHILELDEDVNETRLKKHPVGTGPYTLTKWDPNSETILTAREDHFNGRPNIDRLRIRLIPDLDTQFLELKAEKIDVMGLKPLQFTRLTDKKSFTDKFAKYSYLGFAYTYVGFNLKTPLFEDKLVRQALSYATPRQDIVNGVLMGKGQTIASVFKPGTWAHHPTLKPHNYDVEKAKQLLAQAGWKDMDGDGIVEKDGKPFQFTLITNQGNDQRIKTAEILQQSWRQAGVDVKVQVQEWRTFLENTLYPRNFEAFILGWSLTPEPDPYDIWHSSKQAEREFNVLGFENAAADLLMEEARKEFDQQKRAELLYKFQEILHEEQPSLLLYAPESLIAIHKRIKGIEPAPAGISHNAEDWYVPLSQQRYKAEVTQ